MAEEEAFVFEFDKFISDITSRESRDVNRNSNTPVETTPQREYIQKYRELPQNRTNWGR